MSCYARIGCSGRRNQMRTAILTVGHEDGSGEPWTEIYGESDGMSRGLRPEHTDVDAWARDVIDYFNNTIDTIDHPSEKRRVLISVRVGDDGRMHDDGRRAHDWHKTNLVTISDRIGTYDAMKCER